MAIPVRLFRDPLWAWAGGAALAWGCDWARLLVSALHDEGVAPLLRGAATIDRLAILVPPRTTAWLLVTYLAAGLGLGLLVRFAVRIASRGRTVRSHGRAHPIAMGTVLLAVLISTGWTLRAHRSETTIETLMGLEGGNKVSELKGDVSTMESRARAVEKSWRQRVQPPRGRTLPNIVLVVVDTLRADAVGAYNGHRTDTPFMDRLASQGVVFENAFSTAPWTLAGHGSLFTGTFPSVHGANYDHLRLTPSLPTLAQVLSWAGYDTAAFSSNCWLNHQTRLSEGFHHFVNSCGWSAMRRIDDARERLAAASVPGRLGRAGTRLLGLAESPAGGDEAGEKAERLGPMNYAWIYPALEAWRAPERPAFVFVNIVDPHAPYYFDVELRPHIPRRIDINELRRKVTPPMAYFAGLESFRPVEIESLRMLYDAAVATADRRLERIFDLLDDKGVLENAIVVLTSDHGEYLGEYDQFHHFFGVHEPAIRIPLIIRYPRAVEAGSREKEPTQIIDVFPTLLDLAGVRFDDGGRVLGHSLVRSAPIPRGDRFVIAEMMENGPGLVRLRKVTHDQAIIRRYSGRRYSILDGSYQYVYNEIDEAGTLYLLPDSGGTGKDVTRDKPDIRDRLHKHLMEWIETSRHLADFSESQPETHLEDFPEEFKRQLEALGYVDP